jgi:hypothetical protein
MPTNKPVLRSVTEFMNDYSPVYAPLYPLFLGRAQKYDNNVEQRTFKRLEALGDLRAKHITPKDTELHQVAAGETSKVYKKYHLATQYVLSHHQTQDPESVVAQVLDEHQRHMDDLFLLGEGTSASNMVNNGLFWSNDSNYLLESSVDVEEDANDNYLAGLHTRCMETVAKADLTAGRKVMIFYGTSIIPLFDALYPASQKPFKGALQEVLGGAYSLTKMPADCTPSNTNGIVIANLDQVRLHYASLPGLNDQGSNDEKMYNWFNFMMSSMMLEVTGKNGVVRQPLALSSL